MKRLILPLLAALALPVKAEVDPEVHKMCLQAKDYLGCVKAQYGHSIRNDFSKKELIKPKEKGNKCPTGYAYIGDSKCQVVRCKYAWHGLGDARGNDPLVGGKSDWACTYDLLFGNGVLRLGASIVPITNDSKCPVGEPALGWNSTCEAPYKTSLKKTVNTKLPSACIDGTWHKDHARCRYFEKVTSPIDMD